MSASDVIARLRELSEQHWAASGPFKAPRNRRPLDHLRLAELDRDFVAAASVALPALLECAEALETVRGCGVLPISVGRIVDAALQALAEGGGE